MNLPIFYQPRIDAPASEFLFDEESSRHIIQVLRMKKGELVQVTNGKGYLYTAEIINDHKKNCAARIIESGFRDAPLHQISIAISLLKNVNRFEWFLEKAVEIGIHTIIPLICERTEKHHFRYERMKAICISSMLQSQQVWLTELNEPIEYQSLFRQDFKTGQKFIAHCAVGEKKSLRDVATPGSHPAIILIGPEGDFSPDEIRQSLENHFVPVSLGNTRLRTETAGIVAATILTLR